MELYLLSPVIFLKRFIAQTVYKGCARINYTIVPVTNLNKYLQCGTSGIEYVYRVFQEEWTKLRESVPYVELYRYSPKHLYPKLNGYGDNGQRSLKI